MLEMNDGLRPHYNEDFDEAVMRNSGGDSLEPRHEEALRRIITGRTEPKELAFGQETVLTHK